MTGDKDRAELVFDLWEEAMKDGFWADLTDDELYRIEKFLWGTHEDALREWTRRQMRKADPKR